MKKTKNIITELERFILYKKKKIIKLPVKKEKKSNNNLTRCGRQLYNGSHNVRDVVQCKSKTKKKKKDVVKEQHICQNVGYI